MKQAQVIFAPESYGKGLGLAWKLGWGWEFYSESPKHIDKLLTDDDENTNFITVSDTFKPRLKAVTEKQFKSWSKQKVLYRFHWPWR